MTNDIELKYPHVREELLDHLQVLSDIEHQRRYWVDRECPERFDNFDLVVHFFFDDTPIVDDPPKCVGVFIYNATELDALTKVANAMDDVFDDIGLDATDDVYEKSKHWPQVVSAAKAAHWLLRADGTNA